MWMKPLLHIRKGSCTNVGKNTCYSEYDITWVFLQPPNKCQKSTANQVTTDLFDVICTLLSLLLILSFHAYYLKTSNAELNPICHVLALLGAHHNLHVSRIRVKQWKAIQQHCPINTLNFKFDGSHPDVSTNYQNGVVSVKHNLTFWHRNFTFNSNKSPTWGNNFLVYYPDVCLQLNMFRAFSRASSGAQ
jgi:hypothetical protein